MGLDDCPGLQSDDSQDYPEVSDRGLWKHDVIAFTDDTELTFGTTFPSLIITLTTTSLSQQGTAHSPLA